jgi:hypothetical protein
VSLVMSAGIGVLTSLVTGTWNSTVTIGLVFRIVAAGALAWVDRAGAFLSAAHCYPSCYPERLFRDQIGPDYKVRY